ncbi:MAG: response regulator [Acidobacteria bacterium]|nr:response regulator [Acidobacteriota bacterium]MCA1608287.1 response regulator [Acidobacteriota bacterium]
MGKAIMVVEDHDDSRTMMRLMIESYGYEVIEACDGQEAIDKFRDSRPGLIFMDVNMPRVDGLTATGVIKAYDDGDNVPIVAVTAFTDLRSDAIAAGCDEVLRKPIELDQVKDIIDSFLH